MDENMNGNQPQGAGNPQYTDPNQAYSGQQNYGQDTNGQYYGGQQNANYNQQYYEQNAGGQYQNAQYYGNQGMDPNQAYGGQQYYGQDQNAQYYGQTPNGQYYGGQQSTGGSGKSGFDFNKIKDAVIKNKNIIIIAAAAIVALIIICNVLGTIFGHGKQNPKSVAKEYIAAVEKESGKKAYKLIDKKVIKYLDDEEDMDKDDVIDRLDESMESYLESLQYDADYEDIGEIESIKVKVKRVKKYKGDDLEDMQDSIEDEMDFKVRQVAEVKLKLTLKGEDGKCTVTKTVLTYKRGGKWYLCYYY